MKTLPTAAVSRDEADHRLGDDAESQIRHLQAARERLVSTLLSLTAIFVSQRWRKLCEPIPLMTMHCRLDSPMFVMPIGRGDGFMTLMMQHTVSVATTTGTASQRRLTPFSCF